MRRDMFATLLPALWYEERHLRDPPPRTCRAQFFKVCFCTKIYKTAVSMGHSLIKNLKIEKRLRAWAEV